MAEFPRGKLNKEDEGLLEMRTYVSPDDPAVLILHFGKPVVWVGLDKQSALAMAESLRERAEKLP